MDFELSTDQEALVDGVQSLLAGRFPIETVRGLEDHGGVDRGLWAELGDTGVFSLHLSEDQGGVGLGWADTVLVFEQLGRFLVPGPLVATALAAGLVEGAASGQTVVGVVERTEGTAYIEYCDQIDTLLILDATGIHQVDPKSVNAVGEPRPLDPLVPVSLAAELPQGEPVADADASRLFALRGGVLTSALQLGLAVATTEQAVAYAKERMQFGKPIGAFQAVKHICADMLGRAEVCRAAVYEAGVTLDDSSVGDPARAASTARILANESASANGKDCVQVHGGMGYTWEIDAHLYIKRAWVLETVFGSSDHHAEHLASLL